MTDNEQAGNDQPAPEQAATDRPPADQPQADPVQTAPTKAAPPQAARSSTEQAEADQPETDRAEGAQTERQPWSERVLHWLSGRWDVVQDIGAVLRYTRLSLLVTLAAGLILIFVDQGQELIVILAEGGHRRQVIFYLAVAFWALNAWYWARAILSFGGRVPDGTEAPKPVPEEDEDDLFAARRRRGDEAEDREATEPPSPPLTARARRVRWLVKQVPRFIGAGAFLLIAAAQVKAMGRPGLAEETRSWLGFGAATTVGLAIVFYLLVLARRDTLGTIRSLVDPKGTARWTEGWLAIPATPAFDPKTRVAELPGAVKGSFLVLLALLLVLFALACIDPVAVGAYLGPDVVFLVGASLWIAPGTWLLFIARRGDLPVLSIVVVLGLIFSFTNDNHALRRSAVPDPAAFDERPSVAEAVLERAAESNGPLILVATAGGGSRAAYWTASLLGLIRDLHPGFNHQLIGISGVSGGAVGGTVYRALATALPQSQPPCTAGWEGQRFRYRTCARIILAGDFLGPTLTATLFPDLVQRILPWGFLPDRAAALEQAWERAWHRAFGARHARADLLADDFFQAWNDGPDEPSPLPALFLNGTSVATGKRIVTSNLNLDGTLTDGFDFFAHWPTSIRLSTAANNAARFPIVAPAGTLTRAATQDDGNRLDRIVDGGYFENFGAATALDVLRAIERADRSLVARLVVIQISSDPDYPGVNRGRKTGRRPDAAPASFAGELRSPLQGLLNARTARGALAAQRLYDWTRDRGRPFAEFRLLPAPGLSDPPLGWSLSEAAMANIDCQPNRPENMKAFQTLAEALGIPFARRLKLVVEGC